MVYKEFALLDKNSKCINCVGCELLSNKNFKGKKECNIFANCYYAHEEKNKNLKETKNE